MYINDNFSKFKQRLKDVQLLADKGLYDLGKTPGFKSTLNQKMIAKIHQSILRNPDLLKKIENLKPNESVYVKRANKDTDTRTFCIARDASGEFHMFIEPKSKRSDSTLRDMIWNRGSYKIRKISLRTDTPVPEVYASMISYNATEQSLNNTRREVAEQQVFDNEIGFAKVIKGDEAIKVIKDTKGKDTTVTRTITYSPYREEGLDIYLHKNRDNISREEMSDFILQLLNIVSILHRKGKEHKDLKCENILIYFDPKQGKNILELIDFGFVQDFGSKDTFRGTPDYIPVWMLSEIFAGMSLKTIQTLVKDKTKSYRHYNQTYALDKLYMDLLNSKDPNTVVPRPSPVISAGKHDIWSLAMICYEIHYGMNTDGEQRLKNIAKNRFYSDMLCSTPDETPDIDQVLANFQTTVYKKMAEKLQPTIQTSLKTDLTESMTDKIENFVMDISSTVCLPYQDNELVSLDEYSSFVQAVSDKDGKNSKQLEELANKFKSILSESEDQLKLTPAARIRLATPYSLPIFYAGLAYACYIRLNKIHPGKYADEITKLQLKINDYELQSQDDLQFIRRFKDPYKS